MSRRTEEDLLNPGRIFYQMIDDYAKGKLNKSSLRLLRAVVISVDPSGGQLESNPPNPPNSIRARVYSSGLDANIPLSALTIFYPLFPGHLSPSISPNEHVYVVFEDNNYSSGLWISTIPSYHDLNFSNPDERQNNDRNSSHAFEGDNPQQNQINRDFEYGGALAQVQGRPSMVDLIEMAGQNNPYRNKRVLMVGDSMVSGAETENGGRQPPSPLSRNIENKLITEHEAAFFTAQGRVGWGVIDWVNRNFAGQRRGLAMPQPSLSELIQRYNADIVIIVLGGNDGSTGRSRRGDYTDYINQLWNQAQGVSLRIWAGPPKIVAGEIAQRQPSRDIASEKIRSVVGDSNFVDSRNYTNTNEGRRPDNVHFTTRSPAIEPWTNAIIQKGYINSR